MDPTKKDPKDESIYVGGDVNYIKGAVQRPCVKCGALCWISPAGQRGLANRPMPIYCMTCAAEHLKADEDAKMSLFPESLNELRDYQLYRKRN